MQNIFIELLPPWVETGLQPAFYDKESGTVLQQVSRMWAKMIELGNALNSFSDTTANTVNEYIEKFTELHDYVHDYFDNLDVQDEINNKLEEMADDGTLEEMLREIALEPATRSTAGIVKIGNGISVESDGEISVSPEKVQLYCLSKSSATFVVKTPSKTVLIDTGKAEEWANIKTGLDSLNITAFDYVIITHFHNDHAGNIQNIINTYDCSSATFYIGMKPDYANHSSQILDNESVYDNQYNLLTANGIAPVVPTEGSVVTIDSDNDITMTFYNTSPSIAEGYYTRYTEGYTTQGVNLNDFSLVTLIKHRNVAILSCGDIERPVEDAYCTEMGKVNVLIAPHHGVNEDGNRGFYYALMPDFAVCNFITDRATWVRSWHRSFMYMKETGAEMVTYYSCTAPNDIFTFESDGYVIKTNYEYSGVNETIANYNKLGSNLSGLVEFTKNLRSTITLLQAFEGLPEGSRIVARWRGVDSTDYPQLYSDITAIIPQLTAGAVVTFEKTENRYVLRVENTDSGNTTFTAYASATESWVVTGYGTLSNTIGKTALVTKLTGLPIGHYNMPAYIESDSTVLNPEAYYILSIDITQSSSSDTRGVIVAQWSSLGADSTNTTTSAISTFRSANSPYILWRRINNTV